MTVIILTEYSTSCYGVMFQINGCFKVQKFEEISDDDGNNISHVQRLGVFLGKIEVCDMTILSEALETSILDGNTILTKINEENGKHRFVYIGGDMIYSF